MSDGPLIYIVTGEPSGDFLGARLMAALKARTGGAVRFAGIGGEEMAAQGLVSRVKLAELAIMGVAEVLPRAPKIRASCARPSPTSSPKIPPRW